MQLVFLSTMVLHPKHHQQGRAVQSSCLSFSRECIAKRRHFIQQETMHVPRKRNVASRKRSGCVTCRARRLKCDEAKPHCSNCTRLRLQCGGYVTRFRFRDQTDLLRNKHLRNERDKTSPQVANEAPGTPTLGGDQGKASTHPTPPPDTGQLLAGEIEASPQSPETGDNAQAIVQDIDPDQSHQTDSEAQQRIFSNSVTSPPLVVETFVSPPVASIRASQDHGLIDAITSPASCHGAVPALVETQLERFPLVDSPEQQQAGSTPHPPRFEITGIEAIFPILQNSPASSEWTDQQTDTSWSGFPAVIQEPEPSSVAPPGLFEAAKFPQDMIYYHHLCDPSLSGLLSVLGVRDVLGVGGLDKGFFHAALALSALHMSQSSSVSKVVADCAALHALDHFVDALGYMRSAHLSDGIATIEAPGRGQNTIAWLATLLLLANFELNRGQIKLWYVHSHAAVTYLSHNVAQVGELPVGKSIIRSFSRIAAYLEIFDRSYTACHSLATSNVSAMLGTSLRTSTDPSDRLLYILPRVGEFEEECRTSPQLDSHWRMQARGLIDELKAWRRSLPDRDVPSADEVDADPWKLSEDGSTLIIRPLTLSRAANPAKAATTFMHYLVSLVRLEMKYSPGVRRKLPENGRKLILVACRLAAGVSSSVCAASNAYGHGMVPALMNAYYSSDDQAAKEWIKDWISGFPRDREGIWNVRHAHRLLQYIDQEYSQRGSRLGWEVIKVRMVDLEENSIPQDDDDGSDRFSVEIYSRCARGWSIDFVEIP